LKSTQALKNLLLYHQGQLSAEAYKELTDETARLIQVFSDTLEALKPGVERARKTHQLINAENAKNTHIKTSCFKGCGSCCHLEVEITRDDAELLAESILEKKIAIDENRLKSLALRTRQDLAWQTGVSPENRCVLLDDEDVCRNYDSRPSVCRKHSVTSPASDCLTQGASAVATLIPMNEIIMSAVINLSQNEFGSFARMLSNALEKRKKLADKASPEGISLDANSL
jgi:Fe-S-cluster containining protein